MALIKCKNCGNEIDSTAKKCLICGAKNKPKLGFRKIAIRTMIGFMAFSALGAMMQGQKTTSQSYTQTTVRAVENDAIPIVSEQAIEMAVDQIKQDTQVLDASVVQEDSWLNLVIVVSPSTSTSYAQKLGDNFVRLVKTLSRDKPPSKDIGTGTYGYLVGVFDAGENQIAIGAKSPYGIKISW